MDTESGIAMMTEPESPKFQYSALIRTDAIRLLIIEPGLPDTFIAA